MTILEQVRQGRVPEAVAAAAAAENIDKEELARAIARGHAVVPANLHRRSEQRLLAVGGPASVKVNANIGTSQDIQDIDEELAKLDAAERAGADAVMDLSTGGDLRAIRQRLRGATRLTVGSVPIYEAGVNAVKAGKPVVDMTAREIIDGVRTHAEDGVDFLTVHCGLTMEVARKAAEKTRLCGVVSRGGSFIVAWMLKHKQQNPLFEFFDEIIDISREHETTLSLGDGMRPGALADSMDDAQIAELMEMAVLARRARARGVQVIIEGPGHVPLDQVAAQVQLEKTMCDGAPFYVLGPLVTDVAPGYDHISAAIGGAVAAQAGADFLCYVTPTEHLGLPGPDDVYEGVIAARIAAHAGEIARRGAPARKWDDEFSRLRRERDWEGEIERSIDPDKARRVRAMRNPPKEDACSMCGEYCVFKIVENALREESEQAHADG